MTDDEEEGTYVSCDLAALSSPYDLEISALP
jgi:hypothetical protein